MATIPTYITWVAGTVVTAAQLNANIRDAGNFQLGRPYCNVYNNAGVTLTSGTVTLIPWDTETEDNDSMHTTSPNPSRVIFQTVGLYTLNSALSWGANSSLINRRMLLRLNSGGSSAGGTLLLTADTASASTGAASIGNMTLPKFTYLYRAANVGDYVEVFGEQTLGSSVATQGGTNTFMQALFEIA